MTKYDDFYDVKFFTDKDLVKHPTIRIRHLEYMLSYFFGETKCTLTGDEYRIRLLDTPPDKRGNCFQTHLDRKELENISLDEYMLRFWKLLFAFEKYIYATKKSRP